MDRSTALDTLAAYADAGGRFIDTAESYQGGESEKVVGDFVAGDRDDYIIATKYGVGIRRSEGFSRRGNGRKAMITAVEGSLRRLRTDYIDLYWTHWFEAAKCSILDSATTLPGVTRVPLPSPSCGIRRH